MTEFLQHLLSGILVGSIYSLIALGFVLIFKASSVFNFAQGDLVMIGGFVFLLLFSMANLPILLAFLVMIGVAILLGFLLERLILRPLIGQPVLGIMLMTFGLAYLIRGIAAFIWGPNYLPYPEILPTGSVEFIGVILSLAHVLVFFIVMVLFIAFSLFSLL